MAGNPLKHETLQTAGIIRKHIAEEGVEPMRVGSLIRS